VVTNDAAWAAISEKNNAMLSARLAVMAGARRARGGGLLGGFGAPGSCPRFSWSRCPSSRRAWWFRPAWRACSSANEAEAALRKAVRNNAPEADIQAVLVTVLAEHKAKEDAHAKAQNALRCPLNARQEGSNDSGRRFEITPMKRTGG